MNKPSSKNYLLQITDYVFEHFFDLSALILAGYVVLRNLLKPYTSTDIPILLNILVGLLALLASSSLWHRGKYFRELIRLTTKIYELLSKQFLQRPSSISFFQEKPDLKDYIRNGSKIYLCGVNLTTTIHENLTTLQDAVNHGSEIKILIIDPNSTALEVAGRRTNTGQPDYYVSKLATTLKQLEFLYGTSKKPHHKMQVRLLPYPPSFGILGFDMDLASEKSTVFVEIYLHKIKDKSPRFQLTPTIDNEWYDYFSDQFNKMWEDGRLWQPGSPHSH